MRSEVSIDIDAQPAAVFGLVRDPARWASILPHYRSVHVLRRERGTDGTERVLARYLAVRPAGPAGMLGIPIMWRSWSWADPQELCLHFRHAGGATAGMAVTWRIEPAGGGCTVVIEHAFRRRLRIPVVGRALGDEVVPRAIDAVVIRPVATRTLEAVRVLAEALRGAGVERAGGGGDDAALASSGGAS